MSGVARNDESAEIAAHRAQRGGDAVERVSERDGDDRADVIGSGDHSLTQRAGASVGQGDAVDTGDSPGVIAETADATAGWRLDTDPTTAGDATVAGAQRDALIDRRQDSAPPARVNVEQSYQASRGGFARDFAARAASEAQTGAARTFEQAEPNYRAGFTAGHDLRYEGNTFEDVEPDLRREYETSTAHARRDGDPQAAGGERWALLREEIRAGFDAARNPAGR